MNTQNNPFTLTNKLIFITGASSGIGRQCCLTCSKMGATVVMLGRNTERLAETYRMMMEPEKHQFYAADLLDYDKISDIVEQTTRLKGRIDGLINCAGISTTLPLNSITTQRMDYFLRTNVIGPINLTRLIVKKANFSQTGGSIVFISSVMGVTGESGKSLYSMTKGALISAVKSLSVELAPRKIRVNSISPGVVKSAMSENAVYSNSEESFERIKSLHPLGLGETYDVANASVFLLSDASRWVTGINLIVDGGYLAR